MGRVVERGAVMVCVLHACYVCASKPNYVGATVPIGWRCAGAMFCLAMCWASVVPVYLMCLLCALCAFVYVLLPSGATTWPISPVCVR